MTHPQPVVLRTRNKKRILKELDSFIAEWRSWEREISQITDHPYNRMTQDDVFADGEDNMKRHTLLQERTFAFLNKNIIGHGFVYGQHGENVDRTDLRLNIRVKHRLMISISFGLVSTMPKCPNGWNTQEKYSPT